MTRPTRDEWALQLALVTARRSTCLRRAVGCVLLDARGRVLATGYNGVAAGLPHCNEAEITRIWDDYLNKLPGVTTYPHACPGAALPPGQGGSACDAVHAEQNAVAFCRDVSAIETCYVTCSPCNSCVKLLLNTGCKRVIFVEDYPDEAARLLWQRANRRWEKLKVEL